MTGLLQMFVLLVVVFFAEITTVHADGLFDFQMKLAEKGNAEAQFKVGEMYETGFGVKQNQAEAELWIKKAAAQGHNTAGFKLLYWDMKKNGLKGANKDKYKELLKQAEAGEGQAMYYIGKMYAHGIGVDKNYDMALDWLNKATFIGVVEAEREAVAVREEKQRVLAEQRRVEEKRKAKEQARLEEEKRKRAAEKNKEEERKRLAAENARKEQSMNAEAEREAEIARKKKAEELAAAQAARSAAASAAAEKERKRQALLKAREEEEKERKAKFEADPCSGKSARFLSTCR